MRRKGYQVTGTKICTLVQNLSKEESKFPGFNACTAGNVKLVGNNGNRAKGSSRKEKFRNFHPKPPKMPSFAQFWITWLHLQNCQGGTLYCVSPARV